MILAVEPPPTNGRADIVPLARMVSALLSAQDEASFVQCVVEHAAGWGLDDVRVAPESPADGGLLRSMPEPADGHARVPADDMPDCVTGDGRLVIRCGDGHDGGRALVLSATVAAPAPPAADALQTILEPLWNALQERLRLVDSREQLQQQLQRVQLRDALHRIADLARVASSADAFYTAVHRLVSESMHSRHFTIALLSDDDESLQFPYFASPGCVPPPQSRPLGRGLIEYVLRIGRPLAVDMSTAATRLQIDTLRACGEVDAVDEGMVAWLGVPLVSEDRTLGVLAVQRSTPGAAFGRAEQELLAMISHHVADGIQWQRRLAAMRQANARLEQRVAQLESLLRAERV